MTINELIERLEEYRREMGGDAEVRLMTQSSWPFEYGIAGLASRVEVDNVAGDRGNDPDAVEDARVLFIVEGHQIRYGSKEAWDVAH